MEAWNRFGGVLVLSMGTVLLAACASRGDSRATAARFLPELTAFASHGRDKLSGRTEWAAGATASWRGPVQGPALTLTDPASVDMVAAGGHLPCEFDDLCALAAFAAEEAVAQWEQTR